MEKKRRARINHCLNELKTLILDALKKDVSVNSRHIRILVNPDRQWNENTISDT